MDHQRFSAIMQEFMEKEFLSIYNHCQEKYSWNVNYAYKGVLMEFHLFNSKMQREFYIRMKKNIPQFDIAFWAEFGHYFGETSASLPDFFEDLVIFFIHCFLSAISEKILAMNSTFGPITSEVMESDRASMATFAITRAIDKTIVKFKRPLTPITPNITAPNITPELYARGFSKNPSGFSKENLYKPLQFSKENLDKPLQAPSKFSKENLEAPSGFSKENLEKTLKEKAESPFARSVVSLQDTDDQNIDDYEITENDSISMVGKNQAVEKKQTVGNNRLEEITKEQTRVSRGFLNNLYKGFGGNGDFDNGQNSETKSVSDFL